ncbi:hypothetical protein NQ317_008189 [Molorchus minor]|uniref:Cilia- and flagella-associated protein 206 n=1 Tax=Molorchus minor TaxID=1323400 RepID=A0ABQ9J5Q2_9CUCU|nr:hypothetical protein NQ317_008189 [Molorchus minor]
MFQVKLKLLDPNWGITSDFVKSRDSVDSLITHIIHDLESPHFPRNATMQMQFYFICNMDQMPLIVKSNRKDVMDRLVRLQNDIVKTMTIDGPDEIFMYTKKIIAYITLLSGLGNPTVNSRKRVKVVFKIVELVVAVVETLEHIYSKVIVIKQKWHMCMPGPTNHHMLQTEEEVLDIVEDDPSTSTREIARQVYIEALKAFNSVMDDTELLEFAQSNAVDKEVQLDKLGKVVCGIRLYNKDCQKGGEGIENGKYYTVFKQDLQILLVAAMEKVNLLTTIVDTNYMIQETESAPKLVCKLPPEFAEGYLDNMKDLLIMYRQYELFLRKIHNTTYMRIAIPANIIFPLFEELAEIWAEMQDQVVLLSKYNQILTNIEMFMKYAFYNKDLFRSVLDQDGARTDAQRLEETANLKLESGNEKVRIISAKKFPDIDKIQLQYLGFCCWKLVESDGGLVPGNPSMGVACFEDMYYVFSSPEACIEFSKRPKDYVMRVLELVRKKPHLIHFLDIKEQLQEVADLKQLTEEKIMKTSKEKEVQCLEFTEIMPSNIDRSYMWNIWDLKREAIQLANLSKCKTVSTQTWRTPSRNTIQSQTYEQRDKNLQTKQDNYSNVPKPSNFIYGLRGRKDNEQFIIDLTRPVEE